VWSPAGGLGRTGVVGMQCGRRTLRRGQDTRSQVRDLRSGCQLDHWKPDEGGHRPSIGEDGEPAEGLGGGQAIIGADRDNHVGPSPELTARGADRDPALTAERPCPSHEPLRLLVGEHQLEQPEDAQQEKEPADSHAHSLVSAFALSGEANAVRRVPERLHAGAGTERSSNTKTHVANT